MIHRIFSEQYTLISTKNDPVNTIISSLYHSVITFAGLDHNSALLSIALWRIKQGTRTFSDQSPRHQHVMTDDSCRHDHDINYESCLEGGVLWG